MAEGIKPTVFAYIAVATLGLIAIILFFVYRKRSRMDYSTLLPTTSPLSPAQLQPDSNCKDIELGLGRSRNQSAIDNMVEVQSVQESLPANWSRLPVPISVRTNSSSYLPQSSISTLEISEIPSSPQRDPQTQPFLGTRSSQISLPVSQSSRTTSKFLPSLIIKATESLKSLHAYASLPLQKELEISPLSMSPSKRQCRVQRQSPIQQTSTIPQTSPLHHYSQISPVSTRSIQPWPSPVNSCRPSILSGQRAPHASPLSHASGPILQEHQSFPILPKLSIPSDKSTSPIEPPRLPPIPLFAPIRLSWDQINDQKRTQSTPGSITVRRKPVPQNQSPASDTSFLTRKSSNSSQISLCINKLLPPRPETSPRFNSQCLSLVPSTLPFREPQPGSFEPPLRVSSEYSGEASTWASSPTLGPNGGISRFYSAIYTNSNSPGSEKAPVRFSSYQPEIPSIPRQFSNYQHRPSSLRLSTKISPGPDTRLLEDHDSLASSTADSQPPSSWPGGNPGAEPIVELEAESHDVDYLSTTPCSTNSTHESSARRTTYLRIGFQNDLRQITSRFALFKSKPLPPIPTSRPRSRPESLRKTLTLTWKKPPSSLRSLPHLSPRNSTGSKCSKELPERSQSSKSLLPLMKDNSQNPWAHLLRPSKSKTAPRSLAKFIQPTQLRPAIDPAPTATPKPSSLATLPRPSSLPSRAPSNEKGDEIINIEEYPPIQQSIESRIVNLEKSGINELEARYEGLLGLIEEGVNLANRPDTEESMEAKKIRGIYSGNELRHS